jgi:hypothetical protein
LGVVSGTYCYLPVVRSYCSIVRYGPHLAADEDQQIDVGGEGND